MLSFAAFTTSALISFENASPSIVIDLMPSFAAASSKARLLYQPGVPHFFSVPAFSNDTPIVLAPYPKVAVMRLASPYPF